MAAVVTWLLVINSMILVNGDCSAALGMENGKIKDTQINASHWLYYKTTKNHYVPKLARLNFKSASGAWCSEDLQVNNDQFLEIDLLVNTKVTGIATQGRWNSQEYVEYFQIMYRRDGEHFFRRYNESGEWKEFKGNDDNKKTVRHSFKHPVFTRRIRIFPRGEEFAIYCLRLELYGCTWQHSTSGLVQYSAPLGGERQGVNMKDTPYDGMISQTDKTVTDGLGKLSDDIYGQRNLVNSDGSRWVAYDTKNPQITFKFNNKRLLKKVMIHVNNYGKDIKIFDKVQIYISSDNIKYTLLKTYIPVSKQTGNINAFGVFVDLGEDVVTQYLRLRFTKKSKWLLISEINFFSDTYPPKEVITLPTVIKPVISFSFTTRPQKTLEKTPKSKSDERSSKSSKGLSFPIILTIALVTIVCTVIVSVIIYKSYKKKRKHGHSPRSNTPPQPQLVPTMNKQGVSLLYEEQIMAMQQHQMQQNVMLQNGMYMQPMMQVNAYNTKVVMS